MVTGFTLVLHGSWSNQTFFVWAESAEPAPKPRGRQPAVRPHPYAATETALRAALQEAAPSIASDLAPAAQRTILLPSREDAPVMPPWWFPPDREDESAPRLAPWRVNGLALDSLAALHLLVGAPLAGWGRQGYGADLRYWGVVARLGLALLAQHKYLPGFAAREEQYRAVWLPILNDPADKARLRALAEAMPPACRALFVGKGIPDSTAAPAPHDLLDSFLAMLIDRAAREWGAPRHAGRHTTATEPSEVWWDALWSETGQIAAAKQRGLSRLYTAWQAWIAQLQREAQTAFRLCFRLEPPKSDEKSRKKAPTDWALHYLLQASDDPSLLAPVEEVWNARGDTLNLLNRAFEGAQEKVLAGMGLAARLFPPIQQSLRAARPQSCRLSVDEAYAFLREVGPLLESSGFGVLVPPWWNKPGARLSVRAALKPADSSGKGILNMDSLIQFEWQVALGDQVLTRAELDDLAALKMPLVRVRGQWVMLQPEEIEAAIAFWEKQRRQDEMRLQEALGVALGAVNEVAGLLLTNVATEGWLDELLKQLQAGEKLAPLPAPGGFTGQLRPYQERGFAWLAFLRRWGLGACLADDMGLGKTIQTIALLLRERESAPQPLPPALLICPTSVVGNWKREFQRFAPGLRVMIHHGGDRAQGEDLRAAVQACDVVISTFGLARRDVTDLAQVRWSDVILDEAQNIKNPYAKQTQAIRSLPAANRIALTGTPVENRLSELWSIMQFLNPGFLGTQADFRRDFALPIERYQAPEASERLKKLVGPFILRRVKTDPTIIQDLPDKLEMKVYCTLTPEQATLYEAVVRESLERVESMEVGIERRGIVLGMLMRLKQVCNHPAQFLGDGSALPGRSGKLERLGEMLEEALAVGDKALVFTQFAEMGRMLQTHLAAHFGREILFLHGGVTQPQRDRMVSRFQRAGEGDSPPVLILSLKAGGVGLNLTAANHVFHFDRWWNPAVENQATDRAFRIGQTRDVLVHKFICAGTLEERIDELIESKKALAESVIGAGEGWLTELGADELRDLLTLRKE